MSRQAMLREKISEPEVHDPTPVEMSGHERPLTLREEMRRFIVEQVSQQAVEHGVESFEEADDFDIPEETDLTSQYTVHDMHTEGLPTDDLEGEPTEEDRKAENGQEEPPEEGTVEDEEPGKEGGEPPAAA